MKLLRTLLPLLAAAALAVPATPQGRFPPPDPAQQKVIRPGKLIAFPKELSPPDGGTGDTTTTGGDTTKPGGSGKPGGGGTKPGGGTPGGGKPGDSTTTNPGSPGG